MQIIIIIIVVVSGGAVARKQSDSGEGAGCLGAVFAMAIIWAALSTCCNIPLEFINNIAGTDWCLVDYTPNQPQKCNGPNLFTYDYSYGTRNYNINSAHNSSGSSNSGGSTGTTNSSRPQQRPTHLPSNTYTSLIVYTQDNSPANLRYGPNTASGIAHAVEPGTTLNGIRRVQGEAVTSNYSIWWEINYRGSNVYIYGRLVREE